MHLFEILTVDGSTLSVFASDFEDAATLFAAWHFSDHESQLPDFELRQRNPHWPGLNTAHLLKALSHGISGIGIYDPADGWSILRPPGWMEG